MNRGRFPARIDSGDDGGDETMESPVLAQDAKRLGKETTRRKMTDERTNERTDGQTDRVGRGTEDVV